MDNNINRYKLNDSDYVPTTTHGICEAGSNLPDDIKFSSEFSCEAGEKTKLNWEKTSELSLMTRPRKTLIKSENNYRKISAKSIRPNSQRVGTFKTAGDVLSD